jgi:hypothetical protein
VGTETLVEELQIGWVDGLHFIGIGANQIAAADVARPGVAVAEGDVGLAGEANGLMADVPEPTSFGLLGWAAAGVLARRRRIA